MGKSTKRITLNLTPGDIKCCELSDDNAKNSNSNGYKDFNELSPIEIVSNLNKGKHTQCSKTLEERIINSLSNTEEKVQNPKEELNFEQMVLKESRRESEIKVKRDYTITVKSPSKRNNFLKSKESTLFKSTEATEDNTQKEDEDIVTPEEIEIICQVGSGSFAKVYLCKSNKTNKLYAMKVINKEKLKSTSLRKYSISEKNILSMIKHKFIVKFYSCFQTKTHCFLILEYGPCKDLSTHLDNEGCFSEAKCRFYLLECISAIDALHKKGIIYRDLKPNNIILDCNGDIRLIDFNLSK